MTSCFFCGTTHEGKCPPEAFRFFLCTECNRTQQLPADACFGMDNVFCCSDTKPASLLWKSIDYQTFLKHDRGH